MRAAIRFGRGDLASLDRVSVESMYLNLLKDFGRVQAFGEALSLVRQLSPAEQPDAELFAATCDMLRVFDSTEFVEEASVAFEARLLGLVGFGPHVDACAMCGTEPSANQAALFDALQSSIVCRACGGGRMKLSSTARALIALSLTEAWPPQKRWGQAELRQIRAVLAAIVEPLLGKSRRRNGEAPGPVQVSPPR